MKKGDTIKKEKKTFRETISGTKEIICISILAVMITCLFNDIVNNVVVRLLPERKVTITIEDQESEVESPHIVILKEEKTNELFEECRIAANEGWSYFEGVRGESWTSLTGTVPGTAFTFRAKEIPNLYLAFLVDGATKGELSVKIKGGWQNG